MYIIRTTMAIDDVRTTPVRCVPVPNDTRIDIRLPEEERVLFIEASRADGLPLSLWLRRIAKREAKRILGDAVPAPLPRKKAGGR